MGKITTIGFFVLLLFCGPVFAEETPAKTIINDPKEAAQLIGRHLFTNENLTHRYSASYNFIGDSIVYEKDGVYHIHGGQDGYFRFKSNTFRGGNLRMDGIVTEINPAAFIFKGVIETAELDLNEWNVCQREGSFTFSRKKHPAYWRLQSITYPPHCKGRIGEGEYIDLFSEQIYE